MPKFQHDCVNCISLGEFNDHDLYFCLQSGDRATVIARYGDDGPDYTSGLGLAHLDTELGEAKKRAEEKGLI